MATNKERIIFIKNRINKYFEEKSTILKKITLENIKVANIMHINACCTGFTNLIAGRTEWIFGYNIKPVTWFKCECDESRKNKYLHIWLNPKCDKTENQQRVSKDTVQRPVLMSVRT